MNKLIAVYHQSNFLNIVLLALKLFPYWDELDYYKGYIYTNNNFDFLKLLKETFVKNLNETRIKELKEFVIVPWETNQTICRFIKKMPKKLKPLAIFPSFYPAMYWGGAIISSYFTCKNLKIKTLILKF